MTVENAVDTIRSWHPVRKALWNVVTEAKLNGGGYVNAHDLTNKLFAAYEAATPAPAGVEGLIKAYVQPQCEGIPSDEFAAGWAAGARYTAERNGAALRAAPAQGEGVAVKPLKWSAYADGSIHRAALLYIIEGNGANWTDDRYWLFIAGPRIGKFATLDEAKAAAQSDYEARIRSALSQQERPR